MTGAQADCLWCGAPFTPRTGAKGQRFCTEACRRALDAAGRRWIATAIAANTLTVAGLKDGTPTRAVPPVRAVEATADEGPPDDALRDALHAIRPTVLRIPLAREGIAELMRLGWIDPCRCRDPAALADAVIELADRALAMGLKP